MRLRFTTTIHTIRSIGKKMDDDYRVRLQITRLNYGGSGGGSSVPIAGRRARVLYLQGRGGTVFGSRQVWGLGYRSQRALPEYRAVERSLKARERLGVTDQSMLDMPYCPRPKWVRRRTHRRLVGVIRDAHTRQMRYAARRWPGMGL